MNADDEEDMEEDERIVENDEEILSETSPHLPIQADQSSRNYCVVCKLEEPWRRDSGLLDGKGCHARCSSNLAVCNQCGIHAHSVNVNSDRKILKLDCFRGMTCFEILHSHECEGLWHLQQRVRNTSARESTGQRCEHVVRSRSYNVTRSHPMYKK